MASTEYAQNLRLELKQWETTFAAENDRKPSREDIKKAPEIGLTTSHSYTIYA